MSSLINSTLHYWLARPIWSASFFVLLSMMAFGGPAACVAHCMVLDATAEQQSAARLVHLYHALGGEHGNSAQSDCPRVMQHGHQTEHAEPSALTIAIMLPLLLLPLVFAESFQRPLQFLRGLSIALQPLHRPPRLLHS